MDMTKPMVEKREYRSYAISRLPTELRRELERKIDERDFQTFKDLSLWIKEKGYLVSASAIHRYSQKRMASTDRHTVNPKDPIQMTDIELMEECQILINSISRMDERKSSLQNEMGHRWLNHDLPPANHNA